MSSLKLLTHTAARSAFSFGQQQQCVRAAYAATIFSPSRNDSSNKTYAYNHFVTRNQSHFANQQTVQQFINSRSLLGRCNELQLHPLPAIWSCTKCGDSRSFGIKSTPDRAGKSESKSSAVVAETDIFGEASKLGLFAKFKLMYKKYWYVLIPVHVVTSIGWFGGFYYLSKSGVDVPALLQYVHLSETIIEKVQHSDMGHYAIAYLCYKVATPLRYAVTLFGSTISIKYLVQTGHIKPMPSKNEIIQMYEQKKADRAAAKADKEK